jgi:WD40 repeat protein
LRVEILESNRQHTIMQASYHSSASPDGDCIVYLRDTGICKQNIRGRAQTSANTGAGFHHSKVTSLAWSEDASQISVVSERSVKIIDIDRLLDTARLDNGSGGLGKIVTAEFVGNDHLLAIWEFGKTKLWHIHSGKAVELPDVKTTCDGAAWQTRPCSTNSGPRLFALLSRMAAEDHLALNFSSTKQALPLIKLPTSDAQSLSWSPDGRWLAILDVPTVSQGLHIYTPDGHLFRSYASQPEHESGLGIKDLAWSPDGRHLALAKFDGRVELLNTKTFTPLAVIEHSTIIDQTSLPSEQHARVWQQTVSAANVRSYLEPSQPVSPPLSRLKPTSEPSELGVGELSFSCDGRYLVTRDCRMLNTVWIWEAATLAAHSVLIQHSNVRRLHWHPSAPESLMIDCAEGIVYVYNVTAADAPQMFQTNARPRAILSWIRTASDASPIIMATEKAAFHFIYPDGGEGGYEKSMVGSPTAAVESEEVEDSLFDVLSGRKPLPPKTNPSYTEMVDLDMEAEDTVNGGLDDTFREKRRVIETQQEVDPLDDSEIF